MCLCDFEKNVFSLMLLDGGLTLNCNAQYGAIDTLQADLQSYVNANIETSFEFLLMSTHFGNYEANRDGFKGLYRKLSDQSWADAIDLIKYIAKRGGRMDLNQLPRFKKSVNIYLFVFTRLVLVGKRKKTLLLILSSFTGQGQ